MSWRHRCGAGAPDDQCPRDKGRFASTGSKTIRAVLDDITTASEDEVLDVFHRISQRKESRGNTAALRRLDAELARREKVAKLPPPDDTPEQKAIDDMVRRGWSYADAYADAYGVSGRAVERDQAAALVDRRKGETLEAARRRAYAELTTLEMLQAEEATRGNLVSKRCPGVDPRTLWGAAPARARKCATPELAEWWQANGGRKTYTEFRAQLVTPRGAAKSKREAARLAGSGRDHSL